MDWVSAIIEAVGVIILIIWTYLPIREFRLIHRRLSAKDAAAASTAKARAE